MWVGAFGQTQVGLGENLLKAPQYPGGGTRWLTAEEFSRWGASEAVSGTNSQGRGSVKYSPSEAEVTTGPSTKAMPIQGTRRAGKRRRKRATA